MYLFSKKIKAAVFDMDGTMFDTERLRFNLLKVASKEIYGTPIDDETLIDCFGLNTISAEMITKKKYGSDYPYKEVRQKAEELETEYIRANGMPFKSGLIELLECFKQNGIKMAVATSSMRAVATKHIEMAGVSEYFETIVCGDEVLNGKPDPEIFLKASEKLGVHPDMIIGFEDSENGARASLSAGLNTVLVIDMKEPSDEVKKKVIRKFYSLSEFLVELKAQIPKKPAPEIKESFPEKFNDKVIGIHGFGAIGGGYWTQIFNHWDGYTRPKMIVGATNNDIIRQLVNACGKFQVNYEKIKYKQTIDNVKAIDMSNEAEMINMYVESELIALCLPESAIRNQAKIIALGLLERYRQNKKDISIMFILNRVNGKNFVLSHVKDELIKMAGHSLTEEILDKTKFISTVVNRIVSKISNEKIFKELQKQVEDLAKNNGAKIHKYSRFFEEQTKTLNVSETESFKESIFRKVLKTLSLLMHRESVVGNVELTRDVIQLLLLIVNIKNLNITIFNSGIFVKTYAQMGSNIVENLRQVECVKNISKIEIMKNRLANGPHAIIAWYSALLGYETIGQGMRDERVFNLVNDAIKLEIKPALLKSDLELSEPEIDVFIQDFIERTSQSMNDPCKRVGRDPMRKLRAGDRILGTIELAKKNGIRTPNLEFGIATALLYSVRDMDPQNDECLKIKEIFSLGHSVRDVLVYNDIFKGKKFICMDLEKDNEIITRIENVFNALLKDKNLNA